MSVKGIRGAITVDVNEQQPILKQRQSCLIKLYRKCHYT